MLIVFAITGKNIKLKFDNIMLNGKKKIINKIIDDKINNLLILSVAFNGVLFEEIIFLFIIKLNKIIKQLDNNKNKKLFKNICKTSKKALKIG